MLMLNRGVYKTGLMRAGGFELEQDLGKYDVGIPLSHYLRPRIDAA